MTINKNGERVFSPSFINSIIKPISENTSKIIEQYANEGKNLMLALCNQELDSKYLYINNWANTIKSTLKARGVSKVTFERHFIGNIWHGYIDIYSDNKFYELKVRSHDKAELTTIIQCEIYRKLTGVDYEIWHINRSNGEISVVKIDEEIRKKALEIIEKFENVVNFLRKIV